MKHGGKRQGAGRHRKYPESGKVCSYFVSMENMDWIATESERLSLSKSEVVNLALQRSQD